ncbi:MAG: imidazole glycerol phosphate synthase subunit HisH [Polaribacter sp.]
MIVIIDYGMGNLGSVYKSFKRVHNEVIISSSKKDIESAEKLVLPGVGHFSNGMKRLKELDLIDLLQDRVIDKRTPILGICLGMQLFSKFSNEGNVKGLSWFDAEVVNFNVKDKLRFKVPHMGWNSIKIEKENQLLHGISQSELFYFVHSYHIKCDDKNDILGTTNYSYDFTSIIQKNNIYGTQFHPEKSHGKGLKLIKNFVQKI